MVVLVVRELEARDDPPRLGGVVILDRRFQVLAQRVGLAQLTTQPAAQADLRGASHRLKAHVLSRRSVTNPSRS